MLHLDAIVVGDDVDAWASAGFAVSGRTVVVGTTSIECRADGRPPAWRLWADGDPIPDVFEGITTTAVTELEPTETTEHPNRVVAVDHVVVRSPDLDRTTDAFAGLGVECRRTRDIPGSEPAVQQRFFRFGPVIIELVGPTDPAGDGPASIWGLAFTVDDIDASTAHLGPACGAAKDAVQPGRRIATVRTERLGISVPIAFMTPHRRSV